MFFGLCIWGDTTLCTSSFRTDLNDINLPDQRSMIKSREYIKCHWNQPINHSCTEVDSYRFESHKQDQNAQFLMTAYFVNWTAQQKEPQTKCFLLSLREVKSLWRNSIEMPLWIKKKWCTHDLIEWDKFKFNSTEATASGLISKTCNLSCN